MPAFTVTLMPLGLFAKRQRNVRAALERIIERAGDVDVTASAVVAAVQAYAKINSAGQWIDRSEQVNLNDFFEPDDDRRIGSLRAGWNSAQVVWGSRAQQRRTVTG